MDILMFLAENWDSVLVVVVVLVALLILAKKGETKILRQILFSLVTQAEQQLGDGTGKLKYSMVADWLYQRIPAILKFLFTAKDIEKMIEEVLEAAKNAWSTNERLLEAGQVVTMTSTLESTKDANTETTMKE